MRTTLLGVVVCFALSGCSSTSDTGGSKERGTGYSKGVGAEASDSVPVAGNHYLTLRNATSASILYMRTDYAEPTGSAWCRLKPGETNGVSVNAGQHFFVMWERDFEAGKSPQTRYKGYMCPKSSEHNWWWKVTGDRVVEADPQ